MADRVIAHEIDEHASFPAACVRCGDVQIERDGKERFLITKDGKTLRNTEHVFVKANESLPPDARWCKTKGRRDLETFNERKQAGKRWPRGPH